MFWILFVMLAIVVLASAVVVYVAYPYRDRQVPNAGWLGDTMKRGVRRLPTVSNRR